ncbi:MAG TPA: DUF4352 domain-containing protein [Anaerolineales bacterium]|nr:DUF4352 domain-containing protein [Anaerolineales bacterium]
MARLPRRPSFRLYFLLAGLLAAMGCDASGLWSLLPTATPVFPETYFATLPSLSGSWESVGPAPIGSTLSLGQVDIVVNEVTRPADHIIKRADSYPALEPGEEFALVDVSVTCRAPAGESCNVTEFNFSLSGASGATFYPEFAMSFSGLRGLFDGEQIPSGEASSGDLVFVLSQGETDLVLSYASAAGVPGPRAMFTLGD